MEKSFDVVILSWNRTRDTLAAARSANEQEGVDVSVWVVDQGSEDECLARLRRESGTGEFVLVELGHNHGVAGGRNIGMKLGKAPWVVCLDNDAEFESRGALAHVARSFAGDSSLGAIGFRIRNYFTGHDDPSCWVYPRPLKTESDRRFPAARYCGAGHALRREALERTSLYDENLFFYWEELDLSYQMIDAGYSIVYDPEVVVLHKVSPEARTNWSKDRFYYLVRNALYLDFKYYASIHRLLLRAAGYLVKGTRNRVPSQVVKAYRDAFRLCLGLSPSRALLSKDAREYVHRYDTLPRGSMLHRVRDEVLERLP